jgi:hypothetical protein
MLDVKESTNHSFQYSTSVEQARLRSTSVGQSIIHSPIQSFNQIGGLIAIIRKT